jgi:hypothetical protein
MTNTIPNVMIRFISPSCLFYATRAGLYSVIGGSIFYAHRLYAHRDGILLFQFREFRALNQCTSHQTFLAEDEPDLLSIFLIPSFMFSLRLFVL